MFQFLPFLNYKSLLLIAGAIVCFGAGHYVASSHYKVELAKLNEQGIIAETQALQEQLQKEHKYQQAAQNATDQAKEELAQVDARYNSALRELERGNADSLRYSDSSGSGKTAPPSSSSNSSGDCRIQEKRCDCKNSAGFKRLSRELLAVARDCEINETYLQQMIKMYQAIQN